MDIHFKVAQAAEGLTCIVPRSFCFGSYDDGADDLGVEQRRFVDG
jgi:hypothetical protein